jgi:very-short-patch-repair endonuclease
VIAQPVPDAAQADSDAELDFAAICRRRNFPVPPVQQYRVDVGDGRYTLADWAYPEKKVLVFIDGMSRGLHGDPERRLRDNRVRAIARMRGFQVLVLTAQELTDEGALSIRLEELAVYLGG